jgi:hypothetical protein
VKVHYGTVNVGHDQEPLVFSFTPPGRSHRPRHPTLVVPPVVALMFWYLSLGTILLLVFVSLVVLRTLQPDPLLNFNSPPLTDGPLLLPLHCSRMLKSRNWQELTVTLKLRSELCLGSTALLIKPHNVPYYSYQEHPAVVVERNLTSQSARAEGKGMILLQKLELGDKIEILVGDGNYETVYSFRHYEPDVSAEYIRFVTNSTWLELSESHMVLIESGRMVPASLVQVGDKLQLAAGAEAVRSIHQTTGKGAYAPFTASGTVAVNGVVASSFIAFQNSATLQSGTFDTGLSFQSMALLFETPHRLWCKYVSACRGRTMRRGFQRGWRFPTTSCRVSFSKGDLPTIICAVGVLNLGLGGALDLAGAARVCLLDKCSLGVSDYPLSIEQAHRCRSTQVRFWGTSS